MKRFVATVAVFLVLFSLAPVAHAAEQYTTLYATEPVNVRYGPSTKYAIAGSLGAGDAVQYLGKSGNWYMVTRGGQVGYVYGKYLSAAKETESSVVVALTNVNVRSGPSAKHEKLGWLASGQTVVKLGKSGNWLKIQWGTQVGYVYKKYVAETYAPWIPTTPTMPTTPTSPWTPTAPVMVSAVQVAEAIRASGYFARNSAIYLGIFVGNDGLLCIRLANGTDIYRVAAEIQAAIKSSSFRVAASALPYGVNEAYVNSILAQIGNSVNAFTASQKIQCPVTGWSYDAKSDTIRVQIKDLDSVKIQLFKVWVSPLSYITFETAA